MVVNYDNDDAFGILEGFSPSDLTDDLDNEDEKKLCAQLSNRFEEAKTAKQGRTQLADYNHLLLKGETLIGRTRIDSEVLRVVTESDPRQARSSDNIILPAHRAFVGKFTRSVPMVRVRPRTADRSDIIAAEIMDSFLDYFWDAQKMKLKYKRVVEFISWAGTGIIHLFWDSLQGREIAICPECDFASFEDEAGAECPLCKNKNMSMQMEQGPGFEMVQQETAAPILEKAHEGDLIAEILHFKDAFPDPGASIDSKTCRYFIVQKIIPVSVARQMFPKRGHLLSSEAGLYSDRYIFAPSGLTGAQIQSKNLDDHVKILIYYEMPTGKHPDGRVISTGNNRILDVIPFSDAKLIGRLPFFMFRGDVDADSIWGNDIVSQVEPQQRERDILSTQVRRHRDLTMNPRVLVAQNSGLDSKFMSTTPGEIIRIKPTGTPPRFINPPPMPNYVPIEFDRLKPAAQEKFMVTQHELGQSDPGQSGRYAAILETQASETVGPLSIEVNEEWLELHRCVLKLAQHYMDPQRIWTIRGEDRVMSRSWSEATILPGWDVFVVAQDALSRNPALRLQQAQALLQVGYYTDPSTQRIDWKSFRRDAGLRLETIEPDSDASEHLYAAEIPRLVEDALLKQDISAMPQVMPWDDAFIIASELLGWLRTTGKTKPEPVRRAVAQLWYQYAMLLAPMAQDPDIAKVLPNQNQWAEYTGQQQQAPQGLGAGAMPQGQAPMQQQVQEAPSTAQVVQNADRLGEQTARTSLRQEGSTV